MLTHSIKLSDSNSILAVGHLFISAFCYTFEFRIIFKLNSIIKLTLASEKDNLASAVLPEYSNVSVPSSSSTLKHDDLNPDMRENPEGQSVGAYPQTKGFPRAHSDVFHLNL